LLLLSAGGALGELNFEIAVLLGVDWLISRVDTPTAYVVDYICIPLHVNWRVIVVNILG